MSIKHGFSTSKGVVVEFKDDSLVMNSQRPDSVTITDEDLHLLGVPSVDQVNESMRITLNHRQDQSASNPDIEENADRELIEMGIPSLEECRRQMNIGLTLNQSEGQAKDLKDISDDIQENSDDLTDIGIPSVQEARRQMNLVKS